MTELIVTSDRHSNLLGAGLFSLIFLDIVLVNICQPTSLQGVARGYKVWRINALEYKLINLSDLCLKTDSSLFSLTGSLILSFAKTALQEDMSSVRTTIKLLLL